MSRFLNELKAVRLLSSYGIPMIESRACRTKEEAEAEAIKMKFPLAMKVLSDHIQHKTDAGCVFLGISSLEEVRETFDRILSNARVYDKNAEVDGVLVQEMAEKGLEVIIGMKRDPQFGPVIMVGMGGIYVEVFKDVALRLVPLDYDDAEEMIKETKLYKIIQGARGTKYDLKCLVDTIVKLSELAQSNDDIEEIDINPFFLYEENKGGKGVDALIKCN